MNNSKANAISLEAEIAWFSKVMETRFALHFGQDSAHDNILEHYRFVCSTARPERAKR
jgi:hypothetical protein